MCLEEIMKVSSKMPSYSIDHGRLSFSFADDLISESKLVQQQKFKIIKAVIGWN